MTNTMAMDILQINKSNNNNKKLSKNSAGKNWQNLRDETKSCVRIYRNRTWYWIKVKLSQLVSMWFSWTQHSCDTMPPFQYAHISSKQSSIQKDCHIAFKNVKFCWWFCCCALLLFICSVFGSLELCTAFECQVLAKRPYKRDSTRMSFARDFCVFSQCVPHTHILDDNQLIVCILSSCVRCVCL